MNRKGSKKQTKITNKKKILSTAGKNKRKAPPRSISKKSIERKDKKPARFKDFPIVAIGASAGGIEAISKLLENISPDLGMSYVIIQHLAPDHESILPELLERKTSMPVHQVKDGMEVKADNVYVIPPNTYMSITDGHLRLSPRIKSDGVYHSIDFFLNALAPVYKNKAIAVILSGSATDGSVGVQSIKAEGGITFAQDDSAKFMGMPLSAIDTGFIDLLINVTSFFREPGSYAFLVEKIFPALMKDRNPTDALRIWIPACASGEETYSIAICLFEFLKGRSIQTPVQIFATDINEKAIEKARMGVYSRGLLENVSPKRLKEYFIKVDNSYQIVKSIRDICVFAPHNLLKDPPFSRMDMISCQNVMIYLEHIGQKKILTTFHYALKPTGYLFLGKSETISSAQELFTVADKENKVYKRKEGQTNGNFTIQPHNYYQDKNIPDHKKNLATGISNNNIDKEIEKILLSRYIPASVVVDKDLQVQRFLGTASHYLQPASGKASLHLLKLVRDDLAFDLRKLLYRAKKEKIAVKKAGLVISDNGHSREIEIEVNPLKTPSSSPHFLILFKESKRSLLPAPKDNGKKVQKNINEKRISELEQELAGAKEHLKIISEEFEAAHEELQSSNEEVLSSNEELQSINEELETSREELQSTNEELITINEELQNRNLELKEFSEYKRAIVETIHESLIILSGDLHVKSANKGFYNTFHSNPRDTEGRYLFELGNHQWDIPELREQLLRVQSENVDVVNFEVSHKFLSIGQKVMLLNAQRIPLGENDSLILLAIEDITEKRIAEVQLKESEERFKILLQNAFDIITIFDPDGTIRYESPAIETVLGYTPEERMGKK